MIGCSFCSAPSFAAPADGVAVCEGCAARIGRLAKTDGGEIWNLGERADEHADEQPSFTKMLRVFQLQVAERIATTDSESHYHLAHAYRAMGLFEDAVRAAGTALDVEAPATPHAPALTLLFREPLLREGGLDRLRAALVG